MPVSILSTKLFPPPLPGDTVSRPRLIHRLNRGLNGRLTLVAAPAGFGKSTLASEWVRSSGRPTAWLSLDEEDAEINRFLCYVIAALQHVLPTIGADIPSALYSQQSPSIAALLTNLLNEIALTEHPFILVLDDYHRLDSPEVDRVLAFLVQHLPPPMHLLISTREDPPLPLAQLRARGELSEIRVADLRFGADEAAAFLNHSRGLHLSELDVSLLEQRTEGWVTGLQLAAISIREQQDPSAFIASFSGSHQFVMDYLLEELLRHQPDKLQTFLLQTSMLERLNGGLCDAVLNDAAGSSQAVLDYLERNHLMLIALDNEHHWYRYHHLLADVLLGRLKNRHADLIPRLHQRAGTWFAKQGMFVDAIHHLLKAPNPVEAAALCEKVYPTIEQNYQPRLWLQWMRALPEDEVLRRPVLVAAWAQALFDVGDLESGEWRLRQAEELLQNGTGTASDPNQMDLLPATVAMSRTYLAQAHGDLSSTIHYADQVLACLPEQEKVKRGNCRILMSLAYFSQGQVKKADHLFNEGIDALKLAGYFEHAIGAVFVQADIHTTMGHVQMAFDNCLQTEQFIDHLDSLPMGAEYCYLSLSRIHRERGDLSKARDYLDKSLAAGKKRDFQLWRYRYGLAMAEMIMEQGDWQGALAEIEDA